MKVVGLITEYNPFHNGHKYHLEKSKELSGASHTIAVMSGNFLQRGEPAILDKWERAKIAVKEGVDLVIELPTIFSCNSAEFFALGSISILNSLNIVDSICFGSELGKLDNIELISDLLINEPKKFKEILKTYLDKGFTFPLARQNAINDYLGNNLENIDILGLPNNILAIEYLKALKLLKSNITPLTIKRIGTDYNSTKIKNDICSATAIRTLLQKDSRDLKTIEDVVPFHSSKIIKDTFKEGKGPNFINNLEQIIFYKLRTISLDNLKAIHDISEGLENRFKKGAMTSTTYDELIKFLKTKRYTLTRLQRILMKIIIGITKEDAIAISDIKNPPYLRVLGFSNKGASLLKEIKNASNVPIITNLKNFKPTDKLSKRMIEIDIIATDIYALLYKRTNLNKGGLDFIKKPFIEI